MSDYLGHENLDLIARSHRFNNWMYREIQSGIRGDVLELGSGIGIFSEKIIHDLPNSQIKLTDISLYYVKELERKFSNDKVSTCKLDLNCETDYEKIGYGKFDTIIALNVLEHVEHDEFALQQIHKMLKKEGMLILLVPCHKFLYNIIDVNLGHFRRYTKNDIKSKIIKTKFTIDRMFCFNMLGIVGWYINGNISKNPKLNKNAYKIFDRLVPLSRYFEKIIGKRIGLSIICYLRKDIC